MWDMPYNNLNDILTQVNVAFCSSCDAMAHMILRLSAVLHAHQPACAHKSLRQKSSSIKQNDKIIWWNIILKHKRICILLVIFCMDKYMYLNTNTQFR